jgi:hypothetical protein
LYTAAEGSSPDLPLSTTTLTGRILITSSSGWADDVATSI